MAEFAPNDFQGGTPELKLPGRSVSVVDMNTEAALGSATLSDMPISIAVSPGAVRTEVVHAVEDQLGPEDILGPVHHVVVDNELISAINEAGRALEEEMATNGFVPEAEPTDLFAYEPLIGALPETTDVVVDDQPAMERTAEPETAIARIASPLGELALVDIVETDSDTEERQEMIAEATTSTDETGSIEAELPGLRVAAIGELSIMAMEASNEDLQRTEAIGGLALAGSVEMQPIMAEPETVALGSTALVDVELAVVNESDESDQGEMDMLPERAPGNTIYALAA